MYYFTQTFEDAPSVKKVGIQKRRKSAVGALTGRGRGATSAAGVATSGGATAAKPLVCEICRKKLKSESALIRHIRFCYASNERVIRCAKCGKTFAGKKGREHLAKHVKVWTKNGAEATETKREKGVQTELGREEGYKFRGGEERNCQVT